MNWQTRQVPSSSANCLASTFAAAGASKHAPLLKEHSNAGSKHAGSQGTSQSQLATWIGEGASSWLGTSFGRHALASVLLAVLLMASFCWVGSSIGSRGTTMYSQHRQAHSLTSGAAAAGAAAGAGAGAAAAWDTTDVPMPENMASRPCVDGTWLKRDTFCPVVDCSLAPNCTATDPSCCAHLNFLMLAYLDSLLAAQGMSQHAVIVYGTLLGAVRNKTILPHTHDVDVALSAAAITLLEQRALKEELWRHGYVLWCSDNVWRMCAHKHHPSAAFQALMRPGRKHIYEEGPYLDVYLMWPSQNASAAAVDAAAAAIRASAAARSSGGTSDRRGSSQVQSDSTSSSSTSTSSAQALQMAQSKRSTLNLVPAAAAALTKRLPRATSWELCFSRVPIQLSGRRHAAVEGLRLVVPDNAEQLLAGTYGPRWRTPNLRPYAPTFDQDLCVEAVLRLNATLFGQV